MLKYSWGGHGRKVPGLQSALYLKMLFAEHRSTALRPVKKSSSNPKKRNWGRGLKSGMRGTDPCGSGLIKDSRGHLVGREEKKTASGYKGVVIFLGGPPIPTINEVRAS